MGRRQILAAVGWLAATVAATLVGLGAIRLVGEGIAGTPGGVRDQQEVERALASPEPVSPRPVERPTGSPTPTAAAASPPPTGGPTGVRSSFSTPGGTAVAECGPAGARLVTWSPAQGYREKEAERGPDDHVKVRFVGPGGEYELRVRCVGGRPVADTHD
ncbi:septum formation initiator [Micromonospora sp. DR5-3]|uniref:septum formation initiator n=1 Tax=unclassified Micromonospora TaxID=2617518 RepID=UPI0011DB3F2C|nr:MULTISPECIES: septum formation initiator [unclassified Micromonospora]MCW3815510.1 septum formation initiator [Micromonospora sp. DR5-3]TYC24318.1 septum formation initiator [Micromonospora sp. MP36]